jgi:hypothetical protein
LYIIAGVSPEKSKILCERYPKIFRASDFQQEPIDMWGFECNDGWFELLDTLCNKIQSHIDWRSKNVQDPEALSNLQVVAEQVKEKFGCLRFYVSGGDDITDAFISFAEAMSQKTCETCGMPGQQKSISGWVHVACDPCFEKKAWRKNLI